MGVGARGIEIRDYIAKPVAATLIVAASDSLHPERADYQCDGVDDQVEIQAVLNAMTTGGKLLLLEGRFNISASINMPDFSSITVEGVGIGYANSGSFLRLTNGANCSMFTLSHTNHTYFTNFRNFGLDGNRTNQTATSHGFNITKDASDTYFNRLIINQFHDDGIHIEPSTPMWNLWATNSLFEGCDGSGIYLNATTHSIEAGTWGHIHNNYLLDCKNAVYGDGMDGVKITGNNIVKTKEHGIHILNSPLAILQNPPSIIAGNIVTQCGKALANTYDGIHISNSSNYNSIYDNIVKEDGFTRYGIRIEAGCIGNLVINNDLWEAGITGNFSDAGTGTIYFSPDTDSFIDVLAASATHVINAVDISAYTGGETPAIGAQPDYRRNVTVTPFDNAGADLALTVIVTGTDAKGSSVSETFTFAAPVAAQTGNVAFAVITQVEVDTISNAAAGDTLSVGIGSKLGLSGVLYIAGDVYKVTKNSGDYASANYTVNVTYDTVDVSTGAAIIGSDTFIISFKSNRNRIS